MRKLSLKELNRLSVDAYKSIPKLPIAVVLDNIRSGMNVGSIFRTADAFALEGLHLCGITAQPPHREILKTAIGASQSVDWQYHSQTIDALRHLKSAGYNIVGVEQTDTSTLLHQYTIPKNQALALVIGNEVKGLDNALLPLLDTCLEIPQFGTKHSLNVSVCTGIVLWELVRQIRF